MMSVCKLYIQGLFAINFNLTKCLCLKSSQICAALMIKIPVYQLTFISQCSKAGCTCKVCNKI